MAASILGKTTLAGALALMLASCATTPTPYQPYRGESASGVHGGYSEQRLAPDRYIVRFHGNEWTSRDRVEGYLLYRAAELTVQGGYDWFTMVDRYTEKEVRQEVYRDPFYRPWYGSGYLYWHPDWRYYRSGIGWTYWHPWIGDPFWADRVDIRTVESFEASAEILMRRGPMPASELRAFDARRVMADLGPTIVLPERR